MKKITSALYTNQGKRTVNEDTVHYFTCEDTQSGEQIHVALVSDGLGGHGDGEVASKLAVETVEKCFILYPEFSEDNIYQIIQAAHQNILALHSEERNCKATIVAAFIKNDEVIVAHSGDSRFYSFGRFGITHRTRDHSVSQMAVDMGVITHDDIPHSPDRNRVLHCLGGTEFKADVQTLKKQKHKGILLCTDGFWENVSEKEMLASLRKSKNADKWLEKMIQVLQEKEDEKQDNYSAIVILNK